MAEFARKKKKVCMMCTGKTVDYKDPETLKRYTNEKGNIIFSVPKLELCVQKDSVCEGYVEVICQEACFCKVRNQNIRVGTKLAHNDYIILSHTIIELAFVTHNRIHNNQQILFRLIIDKLFYNINLSRIYHEARRNAIKAETEFIPDVNRLLHIIGGIENIKLTKVQCIGYQRCWQRSNIDSFCRQYRNHG